MVLVHCAHIFFTEGTHLLKRGSESGAMMAHDLTDSLLRAKFIVSAVHSHRLENVNQELSELHS